MDELQKAREIINRVDAEIALLFEERMHAVETVARYKSENGLPILDSAREAEVIAQNLSRIEDVELRPYYQRYLEATMALSRAYQASRISPRGSRALTVHTPSREYPVFFERGAVARAKEFFSLDRRVFILTDDGVPPEYARAVAACTRESLIHTVPRGEGAKSLAILEEILGKLLECGFTREDCLVAVGGGVVGDLGGFAASVFMRGIDFYNIPTTTLSAIDASVGGKTAVNLEGAKNSVGTFYQPKAVLIDADTLRTLDSRQWRSGLCEAVKMAACFDRELFSFLEENEINADNIEHVLFHCVKIKSEIVARDEREGNLRRLLNFGHTIGHAIEAAADYTLTHGECVALGMLPMAEGEARVRIERVLCRLGLSLSLPESPNDMMPYLLADKKRKGDSIDCVRLTQIGEAMIVPMTLCEIRETIKSYYKKGDAQ